ncbi:MAG: nuclear transport factor 2 family protein [Candidatus Methylomirabilales bacterium]
MVTKKPVAITAAVLGVLIVAWFVFHKNEDDRIRQRLHELAHVVSTTKEKRDTARLIHMAGLKQFFTQDVTVELHTEMRTVAGRETLLKMAYLALTHEPSLTVAFKDISVFHDDGTPHAEVNTTVVVTGVQSNRARSVDAQELEMDLVKADGEWLIQAVRPVKAMELD